MFHIFGAIAEFERQLIRERTQAGLSVARTRGRHGGRRTVMTEHKLRIARKMLAARQHTMQEIADTIGVGRATLYRHLELSGPARPPVEQERRMAASAAARGAGATDTSTPSAHKSGTP